MDRMTPPPNYYGAPFPGYNQNAGQQPPAPNNSPYMTQNTPPMMNSVNYPTSSPNMPNGNEPPKNTNTYIPPNTNTSTTIADSICLGWSYSDIAQANRGKSVRLYCSFPDSGKWHDVIIEGRIHYAAEDHICIENKENPNSYSLIIGVYVNYMELFEKPIVPAPKK